MKLVCLPVLLMICTKLVVAQTGDSTTRVMDGFPASRKSQVSFQNYRQSPFSRWSFRNIGAPLHVLMVPRSGPVHTFKQAKTNEVGNFPILTATGQTERFEEVFKGNDADGVIVVKDNTILYEKYWNGLSRDYQHTWFSMTKSLTSTALGILVAQKKVDLSVSPVKYVPELKATPWERTTIQDILNMATALGFSENYTDTTSFFYKYFGSVNHLYPVPGTDSDPKTANVLGVYDFLAKQATANKDLEPGTKFEYNSFNTEVIGWLISRITGKPYHEFIQEHIWSKIGAEHDAYFTLDNAYTARAAGGMNSTLRDAALFGLFVLRRGNIDGNQLVAAEWIDETLRLTVADKERFARNDSYRKAGFPYVAYKNCWWIIDEQKGEYIAVGVHGQVVYLNRSTKMVITYFSSQPNPTAAGYTNFFQSLMPVGS